MIKKIKMEDDDPDYRYWDFRDEIVQVEKMRTIGGNNGKENEYLHGPMQLGKPLIREWIDKIEKL